MRSIVLIFCWAMAVAGLYAAMVVLEVYWNLFSWEPRLDLAAMGILVWMAIMLTVLWVLSRSDTQGLASGISLFLCMGLVALSVYVLAPEPAKPGLLGRDRASPLWYRASRVCVLVLPAAFWVLGRIRKERKQQD